MWKTISHLKEEVNISYEYFITITYGIWFADLIPSHYANDDVLIAMVAKYDSHPSIIAIIIFPLVIYLHSQNGLQNIYWF